MATMPFHLLERISVGRLLQKNMKTSSTRVFLSHDLFADNMPSTTATSVSLASTSTATVTSIATATATTTSVTSNDFVIK